MLHEETRIPVRTLKRYGERFEQPEVEVDAGRARLRLGQERSEGGGRAYFVVGAPVAEDGTVRLALPEGAFVEGAVNADEARALSSAGARMVEVMGTLCDCARLPADCDCCEACDGEGLDEGEVCLECAGIGYAPEP